MAKMKIFELKNMINDQVKANVESKDIQDYLEKKLGVKKTHSSNLEDNEIQAVREHFISSAKAPSAAKKEAGSKTSSGRRSKAGCTGKTKNCRRRYVKT